MIPLSFGEPIFLLLAVLMLPVTWWALRREERRYRRLLAVFGDESLLAASSGLPSRRARLLALALPACALFFGLLALARPQLGERPTALAHTGRDVLVLLDLSRSMNALDGSVTRLAQAKQAISQVLTAAPQNRVGLIVFGGSAFLQLPLTGNQAAFQRFLEAASTDDLGNPATNLSSALSAATTTFEHEGEPGYRSVVVVSDGESGEGNIVAAIAGLRHSGIPVFAIGVGSGEGAPVPADSSEAPEKWHRDHIGRVVISRLEEADLRRAAGETGGTYVRWTPAAAQRIGRELAGLPKRTISSREATERVDRFQWPLALAVLALGLAPLTATTRKKAAQMKPVPVAVVLLMVTLSGCSVGLRESRRGVQLYNTGHYREAYDAFQRAFNASGDPALHYQIGNALYRLRRYEEAAKSFREAAAAPRLRQASYYNLGNAYVRAAEDAPEPAGLLRQALAAYEDALRLDPADSAAKWNLELAVRRRGEDRESGGSPGRGRSADYGRGNMNNPDYEGNPEAAVGAMAGGGFGAAEGESAEELSEAEARQLLEAVEREQLTSHQGRKATGGGAGQKDW